MNEENEDFEANIKHFSSEKLCEIIATFRYLGMMRENAIKSMEELALRRTNGDQFDFETRINEIFQSFPAFKLDLKKIFNTPKVF
jgi:hypothetical protein